MIFSGILAGEIFFDKVQILCEAIASICLISCSTSMVNILLLAFNRYNYIILVLTFYKNLLILRYTNICHYKQFVNIFTIKNTRIFCVITWVIGILIDLPNFLGWGAHKYDVNTLR